MRFMSSGMNYKTDVNGGLEEPSAYKGFNKYYEKDRAAPSKRGDVDSKTFTYLALAGTRFSYATFGRAFALKVYYIYLYIYVYIYIYLYNGGILYV